ncbi:SLC13 family permease [Alkalisalibacterium limincola]|uniref:Sodium-coupled transporter n=1 Tax=Alkalisalibacterium limincola TaxID=2699169 RepID=A0A5C8KWV1_9GAMM|nr:SLC13 family permease [Alkalisalibacterium limincola]TXK64829.1 sodium-coupled transporter [Alkalisalibacterium limincola]
MSFDQITILAILAATVGMFLWGRWRHDMVAAGALLACVLAGLVPAVGAFAGFGHPAVITVACVLVLSRGLQTSGAIDAVTRTVLPAKSGPMLAIAALTALGAFLSAFMNNVGALALLMPVAIQIARKQELAPGQVLMPLAFGSILGGMTTLIGTPPNLIVSGFRQEAGDGSFAMFDFAPVGVTVAVAGVLLIILGGWKLVPRRKNAAAEGFDTGAYLTEVRVPEGSKAVGKSVREVEVVLDENDAQVVGIVRSEFHVHAPNPGRRLRVGDILVVEAEADALADVLSSLGLKLEEEVRRKDLGEAAKKAKEAGDGPPTTADEGHAGASARDDTAAVSKGGPDEDGDGAETDGKDEEEDEDSTRSAVVLQEIAVLPGSRLAGRSASDLNLRTRYSINLLALSREGERSMKRLRSQDFRDGDLLLVQGTPEAISEFASDFGGVPLAERELRIPDKRKAITASAIMALAVGGAAFGLVPAAVSFALGVLASMVLRTVPPRDVYNAIDWPVVVLLAALIPVAGAMEATGTADLIARFLLDTVAQGHAVAGLALILVVTMTLSDLMNNAATAAVMCPIAIGAASAIGVSADPFLMAVAVGASCAFLTPIGHQNNTLILGPGGFRFGDYWRLGLPVQLLVIVVSIPMLLLVWPLQG